MKIPWFRALILCAILFPSAPEQAVRRETNSRPNSVKSSKKNHKTALKPINPAHQNVIHQPDSSQNWARHPDCDRHDSLRDNIRNELFSSAMHNNVNTFMDGPND